MNNYSFIKKYLAAGMLIFFISVKSFACSTFALIKGNEILVGNNDDWFSDVGYLVVKPRGIKKQAFLSFSMNKFEWISKYGSITLNFNFVGDPSGGINTCFVAINNYLKKTL